MSSKLKKYLGWATGFSFLTSGDGDLEPERDFDPFSLDLSLLFEGLFEGLFELLDPDGDFFGDFSRGLSDPERDGDLELDFEGLRDEDLEYELDGERL